MKDCDLQRKSASETTPTAGHSRIRFFISHLHQDDSLAIELRHLLRSSKRAVAISLVLADRRIGPLETTESIKQNILIPRLRWMSTLAVLLTPHISSSAWVQWEIEFAVAHEKHVIGVRPHEVSLNDLTWFRGLGHPISEWSASGILRWADRGRLR